MGIWLWFGFFAYAGALVLLHRSRTPASKTAPTVGSFVGGLAFVGVVYIAYDRGWFELHEASDRPGLDASLMFLTAYLVVYALSFDMALVTSWLCRANRVPRWEQARVRRWSLLGAIIVRLLVIAGAAWIMRTCTWSSYVLGVLVLGSAVLALKPTPRPSVSPGEHRMQWSWGVLSRVRRVSESHHDGALFIVKDGRRVLTRAGVCILTIALHEIIMALDSMAMFSASKTMFIVVSANALAAITQRSWCFGDVERLAYPRIATALLLAVLGAKLVVERHVHVPHAIELAVVALIACGVTVESILGRPDHGHDHRNGGRGDRE